MGAKGSYPLRYSENARAALELFASLVAEELGLPTPTTRGVNPVIAERMGVTAPGISKLRRGKQQMQMGDMIRLSELLGVTPNDVLFFGGRSIDRPSTPPKFPSSGIAEKRRK